MYNTALITDNGSMFYVTLVNGELETVKGGYSTVQQVARCLNENGIYSDSVECSSYDLSVKYFDDILSKVNARPAPFIIASMGSKSFCTDPALTIESATELAIELGTCEKLIFPVAVIDDKKAIITVSEEEMHILKNYSPTYVIDRTYKLVGTKSTQIVNATYAYNADLYFAPNTSQELINEVRSILGA